MTVSYTISAGVYKSRTSYPGYGRAWGAANDQYIIKHISYAITV